MNSSFSDYSQDKVVNDNEGFENKNTENFQFPQKRSSNQLRTSTRSRNYRNKAKQNSSSKEHSFNDNLGFENSPEKKIINPSAVITKNPRIDMSKNSVQSPITQQQTNSTNSQMKSNPNTDAINMSFDTMNTAINTCIVTTNDQDTFENLTSEIINIDSELDDYKPSLYERFRKDRY